MAELIHIIIGTIAIIAIIAYCVSRLLLSGKIAARRRSRAALLVGMAGSGKTTLFAQLVAGKRVAVRTSMEANRGDVKASGSTDNADSSQVSTGVTLIDFPGHRRLRESLLEAVEEVKKVIFVVDSVTIQDPHEGAEAVAELMVAVLSSPAFYGVEQVMVACTKRDELTSYSAKSVQKLLEKEITHCLTTRSGGAQRIENIVNASGVAVGLSKSKYGRGSGAANSRSHEVSLDESGKFSFSAFAVPVHFADISSFVGVEENLYNVEPVREFVIC
uniref:Signal recognition particle receptor subunit beta n=1 Tax=Trypanosoma congolense (strain IL3000) TaxID=1068625 RepID=G0UJD3_TRYCI|nr:unnamed protein product [Trypanosoma congolense IL3000]